MMIVEPTVEQINQLLLQFTAANGLPFVSLGENATCSMKHSEGFDLHLELSEDATQLHWYTRLCEVPPENREDFYSQLLQMNLLGVQTRGGLLGIEPRQQQVVYSIQQPVDRLDLIRFTNVTENFLATTLTLRSALTDKNEEFLLGEQEDEDQEANPNLSWQMRV